TDLRSTVVIARRELLERIQSKWFIAMTVLGPLFMVAAVIIPPLLIGNPAGSRVEIIDRSGAIGEPLKLALTAAQWKPEIIAADTPDAVEMSRIRDKKINGFVVIPGDVLDGGTTVYRGDNGSSPIVQATLREMVSLVVRTERGK